MKPATFEFFFAGAARCRACSLLGDPGLAAIVLVGLLLAACLGAMADPEAPFRTMAAPGSDEEGRRRRS